MDDDDQSGEVGSLRSESPGMFVDQPEDLLDRSTGSTSPNFTSSRSPPHNAIGDTHDAILIDDDEQEDEGIVGSQDHKDSSSSGHRDEEVDAEKSRDSNEPDDAEDVNVQEAVQEAHEADRKDPSDSSDGETSFHEEGDLENDEETVAALMNQSQTGGTGCHGCDVLTRRIQGQARQIQALKKQILDLEKTLDIKRQRAASNPAPVPAGPRSRGAERTWQRLMRQRTDNPNATNWAQISRVCAREENYPLNQFHPHIQLVKRSSSRKASPIAPPNKPPGRFQQAFPDEILVQILREVLVFDGQLIFVFSRLDRFVPSESLPTRGSEELSASSGLRGRLYMSNETLSTISLTHDTISPDTILAPLLVSRKWNFYGVNQFYGGNTFAFSSFGEFDRFCK